MNFFDIQVNGYAGVDFNQDGLSRIDLLHACGRLRRDGTGSILATIITDQSDAMARRIETLARLKTENSLTDEVIAGIHIEGPFLSAREGFRGAHPEDAIRAADVGLMRELLAAGRGQVRLVTLAPEQDPSGAAIRFLRDQGVAVSAGHTDATLEELRSAIRHGLSLFTHLGNACPASLPRHDNIIQRALFLRDQLTLCFIADGVHIPTFVLKNYLDLAGLEKSIVTTDAMAAAGLGPGRYKLGRWDIEVGSDRAARAPGGKHLVGSAASLPYVSQKLTGELGLSETQVLALCRDNPRRAIFIP